MMGSLPPVVYQFKVVLLSRLPPGREQYPTTGSLSAPNFMLSEQARAERAEEKPNGRSLNWNLLLSDEPAELYCA